VLSGLAALAAVIGIGLKFRDIHRVEILIFKERKEQSVRSCTLACLVVQGFSLDSGLRALVCSLLDSRRYEHLKEATLFLVPLSQCLNDNFLFLMRVLSNSRKMLSDMIYRVEVLIFKEMREQTELFDSLPVSIGFQVGLPESGLRTLACGLLGSRRYEHLN